MKRLPFPKGLGSHETYMKEALVEAEKAARQGEVPVGAILVAPTGDIISRAQNQPIGQNDPTAHAEVQAIRKGAAQIANYRLPGHVLYVTPEPCVMCVGAMVQARLARVVYGAVDVKTGAVESVYQIGTDGLLNDRIQAEGGVLAQESRALLQAFFRSRR
jgi:tRNA(Arg) A34 adenosine deaminase TadA